MRNKKLTLDERTLIAKWHKFGAGVRTMAASLGRSPSTVSNELRRNREGYASEEPFWIRARNADALFRSRRLLASKRMRLKSLKIRYYVEQHIGQAGWTPEVIAGALGVQGHKISAQAIYDFIDAEGRHDLNACLPVRGRARRRRSPGRKRRRPLKEAAAPKLSIERRPEAINLREYLGDFECDAVIGKQGGSALQVLVDRRSRKLFLKKVPSLCANIYSEALIQQFYDKIPPQYRNSITMDNGAENAMHVKVDASLEVVTYFCHPYCASERGTVENRNKAIRRFFPKGTDFDLIPDEYIQWVEDYLNCMPMKVLGFLTPDKIWNNDSLLRKAA